MPLDRARLRYKDVKRNLRYYLLAVPLIATLSRLPMPAARALGWLLGTLASVFARTSRKRSLENLEQAFGGGKSPRELRRISREVFRHTATNVLELLVVHRWSLEKTRRFFALEEDFERLQALARGGAVGVTAHFGNWELLGVLTGAYVPGLLAPVAKRIYFGKFQALVERFRAKAGLEVIYTDESPRRMVEALQSGKLLGMLPDQNLKAVSGVFVDFFGRPAYTSTTPAHLAMTNEVTLLTCFLVRQGGGYRMLLRGIPVARTGRREDDLRENTRRWTQALEEEVRARPEQWAWFHRRWRTRPEDGPRKIGRRRSLASLRGETPPAVEDPPKSAAEAGSPQ